MVRGAEFQQIPARMPANGIILRDVWRLRPRLASRPPPSIHRQLDAGVKITASDGEAREIKAGEIILVEDLTGKGHLSKSLGGQMQHSLFIPID